jgi:hypothetical protein
MMDDTAISPESGLGKSDHEGLCFVPLNPEVAQHGLETGFIHLEKLFTLAKWPHL